MPLASLGLILQSLALPLTAAALQSPPSSAQTSEPIIVTGARTDEHEAQRKVEKPYSITPRVVTGSRIPHTTGRRLFNTVASDTGLAGLIADKNNNFDAAGGSVPRQRDRRIIECRADREEVSEETACALFDIAKALDDGDHVTAAAKLDELKEDRSLHSFDRYYVAFYQYKVAEARADERGREDALKAMLASGRMPWEERLTAQRTLVAMALKRGDNSGAIAALEKLTEAQPDDARSQANLAALYDRSGFKEKARQRMTVAVAVAGQSGAAVPRDWIDYLQSTPR